MFKLLLKQRHVQIFSPPTWKHILYAWVDRLIFFVPTQNFDTIVFIETNWGVVIFPSWSCVTLFLVRFHLSHLRKSFLCTFFCSPAVQSRFGSSVAPTWLALCHEHSLESGTMSGQTLEMILGWVNVLLFVHGGVEHVTHFRTCWTTFVFFFCFCFRSTNCWKSNWIITPLENYKHTTHTNHPCVFIFFLEHLFTHEKSHS